MPQHTTLRKLLTLLGSLAIIGTALYYSQSPSTAAAPQAPTPRAVDAAKAFLASLDDKQRDKVLLDYASDKKPNWSNLPVTMVKRNGLPLGDLSKDQRDKALAILAAILSNEGYQKMIDIMDGDQRLVDNQKGNPKGKAGTRAPMFGRDLYYLALFGQPSETKPWMVQFGGHHLGLNVTIIGKHFILTPTHTGAQPALFKRNGNDVRPLGREIDAAYKLLNSLDENQRKQAILSQRPQGDLLVGPGRDGKTIEPKGIKGSSLSADQQALLLDTIAAWVNIVEPDSATARLNAIKQKLNDTHFAWMGLTEKDKPVYFRIQGPNIIIEYAPQNSTDHIHTIIRNPEDDYGAGTAKQ